MSSTKNQMWITNSYFIYKLQFLKKVSEEIGCSYSVFSWRLMQQHKQKIIERNRSVQ